MARDQTHLALGVVHFLGELRTVSAWGAPVDFYVMESANPRLLLFSRQGGDEGPFPVRRDRLRRPILRALLAGQCVTTAARNAWDAEHRPLHPVLAIARDALSDLPTEALRQLREDAEVEVHRRRAP